MALRGWQNVGRGLARKCSRQDGGPGGHAFRVEQERRCRAMLFVILTHGTFGGDAVAWTSRTAAGTANESGRPRRYAHRMKRLFPL